MGQGVALGVAGGSDAAVAVDNVDDTVGRGHTIIENAEKVIAFWDRTGRGTAHSIQLAKEKKIPVLIVPF